MIFQGPFQAKPFCDYMTWERRGEDGRSRSPCLPVPGFYLENILNDDQETVPSGRKGGIEGSNLPVSRSNQQ